MLLVQNLPHPPPPQKNVHNSCFFLNKQKKNLKSNQIPSPSLRTYHDLGSKSMFPIRAWPVQALLLLGGERGSDSKSCRASASGAWSSCIQGGRFLRRKNPVSVQPQEKQTQQKQGSETRGFATSVLTTPTSSIPRCNSNNQ